MTVMTRTMLQEFLNREFPEIEHMGFEVAAVDDSSITMQMKTSAKDLRPGGTVSGPTLMSFADVTMYLLLLAQIGPVALAVTTNLNINFLNKPNPGKLRAEGRLLKHGKLLATGDVSIFSNDDTKPVAHATLTYAIPPQK